jgi:PadR family transcriptional regulator, regulatory protein AphA
MSLQHLILGILKYGPMSGYDLNKAFQASVQHFWETDQSQIYRALYKMHEAAWVEVESVLQESLPAKKIYRLTEVGREELHRWLAQPKPFPTLHEAWLGQLFFGAELDKAQLKTLLEARISQLKALITHYENDIPISAAEYAQAFNTPEDMRFWLLTLDYGIKKFRFDLEWSETALQFVQQFFEAKSE